MAESSNAVEAADAIVPSSDRLLALYLSDFRRDAFFTSNNMQLQVIEVCSRSRSSLGLEQQLLLLQAQFECGTGLQALDELRARYGSAGAWPPQLFDASQALLAAACSSGAAKGKGSSESSIQPQAQSLHSMRITRIRILAERMRAALGHGQLQPNASASFNLSEGQPSMPHDWMLEQALSQVMLTKIVNLTVVTVAILLLVMPIGLTRLQFTQSAADASSGSGSNDMAGIEADLTLLGSHLRVSLWSPSVLSSESLSRDHVIDAAHCGGRRTTLHPAPLPLIASSRPLTLPTARESQTTAAGAAGADITGRLGDLGLESDGVCSIAADSGHAVAMGGSGCGAKGWVSLVQRTFSRWYLRVVQTRLLDLWTLLRRASSIVSQLFKKAMTRVVQELRSSGSSPGNNVMRRQQVVLALASIVLMAIHIRSDKFV